VYIKTGNLINGMTILIQYPCLYGGVVSESCHDSDREKEKIERRACVPHIPGQGDITTSPSLLGVLYYLCYHKGMLNSTSLWYSV
jgi:hypothetical protein